MKQFDSGVAWYAEAELNVPVFFPEGEVCCWYCPLLIKSHEECRLTNETIYKPKQNRGYRCPLKLKDMEVT